MFPFMNLALASSADGFRHRLVIIRHPHKTFPETAAHQRTEKRPGYLSEAFKILSVRSCPPAFLGTPTVSAPFLLNHTLHGAN